jgi:hypothetical protein
MQDFTSSTLTPDITEVETTNTAHTGQAITFERLRKGIPQQPVDAPVMDGPVPFKNMKNGRD